MRSGASDCATTTGEVWIETLNRRRCGSERPRRKGILRLTKDILRLLKLYGRLTRFYKMSRKRLLVSRMLALRRSDTKPRTSLRGL